MSWREILGAHARNSHIAQNSRLSTTLVPCTKKSLHRDATDRNFANSACSTKSGADERDSELLELLSGACEGLRITPLEVRQALAQEDIEDWASGKIATEAFTSFARSLVQRQEMDAGKRPDHYTKRAQCTHCGPIWLWVAGEVFGCPWCWNRMAGRPIPRPQISRCAECQHFSRIDHPHLGHCKKGCPEGVVGLWDTDARHCNYFHPST